MKTFSKFSAQGEITILRLGDLPDGSCGTPNGYTELGAENGVVVVGHSETGHHHVIDAGHAFVSVLDKPSEGMRILRALVTQATPLVHQRPTDTHESIMLEPGEYEFRIGREYDPYEKLARQVAD